MIQIFIPGAPVAQPRARATIRGKHAGIFNPKTADVWKACIIQMARRWIKAPFNGPIRCELAFTLARPQAHYRSGKHAGELKETAPDLHSKKPDADNLAKAALDALTQAGAWGDDSQVAELIVRKRYGARNETGVNLTLANL